MNDGDGAEGDRCAGARLVGARLQWIVDPRIGRSESELACFGAALSAGVELLQLRAKGVDTERLVDISAPWVDLARAADVPVLVNDDVAAAARLGVEGVHLGQDDWTPERARGELGPDAWIGWSTHSPAEVREAVRHPVTHLGLGACFATTTKLDHRVLARDELAAAVAATALPVFAIGGIDAARLPELLDLGVRRVAVSSAISNAADPGRAAAELSGLLHRSA